MRWLKPGVMFGKYDKFMLASILLGLFCIFVPKTAR
jgi:hypothetical protein